MAGSNSMMFTVSVNYDDPRWREIRRDAYVGLGSVFSDLTPQHFFVDRHGISEAVVEYITLNYEPTTQEVLDEIKRRGLHVLDRPVVESFLDKFPEEQKKSPIIGFCGSVEVWHGFCCVVCVIAVSDGRGLESVWYDRHWLQSCRFLAVRK